MLLKTGQGSLLKINTGSLAGMLWIKAASPRARFARFIPTLFPHRPPQTPPDRLPTVDAATAVLGRLSGFVCDKDGSLCADGEDHSSQVH